jgi:chondroitin AC lyase
MILYKTNQPGSKPVLRNFSLALILLIVNSLTVHSQINIVTERLRSNLISGPERDSIVANYLNTLKPDGSWGDIDYTNTSNTNWQPGTHTGRLRSICTSYNKPTSKYYHLPEVKTSIQNIIDFYISAKPTSANWWYNAIGAPISLGPALILMKTGDAFGFDQAKLDSYSDQLLNYFSESAKKWPYAVTGANKIWLLNSSIAKACIKNNAAVLDSNFRSAFEEAKIFAGIAEGIKSDFSFYQHGTQLYCGGYGMAFMGDITSFGLLAHGTSYQMRNDQLQLITDEVVKGFQWFIQKSAFDFGAVGREISRRGAATSAGLKTDIDRLRKMNVARSAELTDCYNFIDGTADFPNPGNRHFWKSDIMIQHGPAFYLSARVPSKRTIGSECMNNENLRKKWLPWGATNIMIDGDEYRNIFSVWDWARIPGVTTVKEEVPIVSNVTYIRSENEFAGGVSNGVFGLAAFDYSWDGISGKKAYFFSPEAMYCFGAGIKASKDSPVITNINQCFSSGTVTLKSEGAKSTIDEAEKIFSKLSWIHHDSVGYYFPSRGEITVKNQNQSGSWHDINLSSSQTVETFKVFSAWIGHGNAPNDAKYEYIVVPSKSLDQFETWVKNVPVKTILNTAELQVVYDKNADIYGVVFYKPGNAFLEPGLSVIADKPCLLLMEVTNNKSALNITVSDPTATLKDVNLTISIKLKGTGSVINSDNTSSIKLVLPSGDEAGKSVTFRYDL